VVLQSLACVAVDTRVNLYDHRDVHSMNVIVHVRERRLVRLQDCDREHGSMGLPAPRNLFYFFHMDIEARRDLQLLEAVEENARVTQRSLATRLGIALGLTNIYLKRLTRKGFIKCINVQPNRITYLITPGGVAEKMRLTYEFMDYSLKLYGEVRQHLRAVLQERARGNACIAIFGRREAAEIAYLSLRELGLEPLAFFDHAAGHFLGMVVRPIVEHTRVPYELLVLASFDANGTEMSELIRLGVPPDKILPLRQPTDTTRTRSTAAKN
jgi:DNA-binding Lrp family transcriptional regulator